MKCNFVKYPVNWQKTKIEDFDKISIATDIFLINVSVYNLDVVIFNGRRGRRKVVDGYLSLHTTI